MAEQLNVSTGVGKGAKKRRRLSAEDKYQIFLEASQGEVPVAMVLRKWGIYSSDLAQIRELVRKCALDCFYRGNGKVKEDPQVSRLRSWREGDLRLLVMPDQPAPIKVQTHTPDPVPFLLWGAGFAGNEAKKFTEAEAEGTGLFIEEGYNIIGRLIG